MADLAPDDAPVPGAGFDDAPLPVDTSAPQAAERILNQDEIDSLLGFDLADDDGAEM